FRGKQLNLLQYCHGDPINFIDIQGTDPGWAFQPGDFGNAMSDWEDVHDERNRFNRCPAHPPEVDFCNEDGREWNQDSWGDQKYRGSDGSECVYDERGNLLDEGTFNYCANPWTICHIFLYDVLPQFWFGAPPPPSHWS